MKNDSDLNRVGLDFHRSRFSRPNEFDGPVGGLFCKFSQGLVDEPPQIERFGLGFGWSREQPHVGNHLVGPADLGNDQCQFPLTFGILFIAKKELRSPPDDRQRVVDFVPRPGGEFCQGFELLHLQAIPRTACSSAASRPSLAVRGGSNDGTPEISSSQARAFWTGPFAPRLDIEGRCHGLGVGLGESDSLGNMATGRCRVGMEQPRGQHVVGIARRATPFRARSAPR